MRVSLSDKENGKNDLAKFYCHVVGWKIYKPRRRRKISLMWFFPEIKYFISFHL